MHATLEHPLPDGSYIAVHRDSIWVGRADGEVLHYAAFPDGLPGPIAISNDGDVFFLSGSALSVWRRSHPEVGLQALFSLPDREGRPVCSVSRDGSHLIRRVEAHVDVWRIADQRHLSVRCQQDLHMSSHYASLSPEGRWLEVGTVMSSQSGSDVIVYQIHSVETGEIVVSDSVTDTFTVCFSKDDCTLLVVVDYGEPFIRKRFDLDARVWRDRRAGEPETHRNPVRDRWLTGLRERHLHAELAGLLAVSDDGRYLTNGEALFDGETGAAHTIALDSWKAVAFQEHRMLLINQAGELQTCAPGTVVPAERASLAERTLHAALSPDGGSAAFIPWREGQVVVRQAGGQGTVLATFPDKARLRWDLVHAGSTVAIGTTRQVSVTRFSDGASSTQTIDLQEVGVPAGRVKGLAITRSGDSIAVCTEAVEENGTWRAAVFLSRRDGEVAGPVWFTSEREVPRSVSVWAADDGKERLAIGQLDTVEVWQTRPLRRQRTFQGGHRGGVVAMCFSADGDTLYCRGLDTTVVAWDLR